MPLRQVQTNPLIWFTMKVALCLFVLVAAVCAAPSDLEKRLFLEDLDPFGLFNISTVEKTVCGIAALGSSAETETTCEALCHTVLQGETVAENFLHSGCPFVCNSLQYLLHLFPC